MKLFYTFILAMQVIMGFCQNIPSAQLPAPNKLSLVYLKGVLNKTILYGSLPPNYNGKVLVFNHGYIESTDLLLLGNSLYQEAYNAGYKVAFVATTRGQGDWVNGEILSRALTQVSQFYNAKSFDLIVHSNGGKASEVALFYYKKRNLVNKVISLGTPFRGTQIADISQRPSMKWLVDLTGLGKGAQLSTTYYCDDYFRPLFDNHPLNQPKKYYNFGAWGYKSFKGIYSPIMFTTGNLMLLNGSGPNDGVTPFYSSTRPGGTQIATLGDSRGDYNHMDILYGQRVWRQVIYPVLSGNFIPVNNQKLITANTSSTYSVKSNYQIVSSSDINEQIIPDANARNLYINLIHENATLEMKVIQSETNSVLKKIIQNPTNSRSTENPLDNHISSFTLENNKNVRLLSNSNYVAYVTDSIEKPMVYELHKKGEKTWVEVSFPELNSTEIQNIQVKASIQRTGDLKGIEKDESEKVISFSKDLNNRFISDVSENDIGIYSLYITAEIPNEYRRNIISGFVLEKGKAKDYVPNENVTAFKLSHNPVNTSTFLQIPSEINEVLSCEIISIGGNLIQKFDIKANTPTFALGNYISSLGNGYYILSIKTQKGTQKIKFLK